MNCEQLIKSCKEQIKNQEVKRVKVERKVNSQPILSLDAISRGLKDKRLYDVSKACGVSYPVLKRLLDQTSDDFRMRTLRLVSAYIIKSQITLESMAVSEVVTIA